MREFILLFLTDLHSRAVELAFGTRSADYEVSHPVNGPGLTLDIWTRSIQLHLT